MSVQGLINIVLIVYIEMKDMHVKTVNMKMMTTEDQPFYKLMETILI